MPNAQDRRGKKQDLRCSALPLGGWLYMLRVDLELLVAPLPLGLPSSGTDGRHFVQCMGKS